jgi:hypothetical protein
MSQNDNAVLTAAIGYVYTAAAGTPRPTPAQIASLDGEAFGSSSSSVTSSVPPTGGTFKVTVGGGGAAPTGEAVTEGPVSLEGEVPTPKSAPKSQGKAVEAKADPKAVPAPSGVTGDLPFDSGAAEVQTALEAIESVGVGNVKVSGTGLSGDGFVIAFVGTLAGQAVEVTADGTKLVGGSTLSSAVVGAPNGWTSIGHTSRGDLPEFGYDGGDTEVKGTWQNESLREVVTSPIADYLTLLLHQFDTDTFELYYGKDAAPESGVFGVSGTTAAPVEKAILIIIQDGDTKVGFYSPKASIRRDDSISLAVDDFAALPVRATFLKYGSKNKFEWINEDLFS